MGRYNFVSPGAAAGNAIQEFLIQRALQDRQRQLDALNKQNTEADNQRADAQLALQRQQEARVADLARQTAADKEDEQQYRRASNMATIGLPSVLSVQDADALRKYGYGGLITEPTPGVLQFAGGSQYQNARTSAAERAAEAEKARQAAAERADADRQTREMIAGMSAQGRNATADLDRQIKQQKIDAEAQKQADAEKAAKASADAVSQYQNDITSTVNNLLDEQGNLRPDAAGVVGMLDSRTPTIREGSQGALAQIDRLVGMLDINKLREMKAQSKTGASGFGALSEKELNVLENAASLLRNRGMSEAAYAAELKRIRDTVNKQGGVAPAPSSFRVVGVR
jgi:hypothetical protein